MIGAVLVALVPLVAIVVYVVSKGLAVMSASFLTENLPISEAVRERWHRAGDRRHADHHRRRGGDRDPARRPRRDLPQRVRPQRRARRRHPLHGRRDGGRAVDRDGTLRRDGVGELADSTAAIPDSPARSRSPR